MTNDRDRYQFSCMGADVVVDLGILYVAYGEVASNSVIEVVRGAVSVDGVARTGTKLSVEALKARSLFKPAKIRLGEYELRLFPSGPDLSVEKAMFGNKKILKTRGITAILKGNMISINGVEYGPLKSDQSIAVEFGEVSFLH